MINYNKLTLSERVEMAELSAALVKAGYDVSNPFKFAEYYDLFKKSGQEDCKDFLKECKKD